MTNFQLSLIAIGIFLVWLFNSINILREYERGVVFRLGRLLPAAKGPGLIFVFFPIDRLIRVGLRTITMDVPTQDVITADNVTVKVNAVVYFRVVDAPRAIVQVENYLYATSQIGQTTWRPISRAWKKKPNSIKAISSFGRHGSREMSPNSSWTSSQNGSLPTPGS